MKKLSFALLLLVGCTRPLPVCSSKLVATDEWSRPCRSAHEVNTSSGNEDMVDPTVEAND